MSKRNSEGDVLFNRVSVKLADSQRLLASILGPKTEADIKQVDRKAETAEEDLQEDEIAPERIGVGAPIPKDIKDGNFTRRTLTSDDKLLQQLIGKKAAKAHQASKQAAHASGAMHNKTTKPIHDSKPEESDDEEEGRAATFKSKKRKKSKPQPPTTEEYGGEQLEGPVDMELLDALPEGAIPEDDDDLEHKKPKLTDVHSNKTKPKPASYLDEVLAERSSRKKKKKTKTNQPPTDL